MKIIVLILLALVTAEITYAQCAPDAPAECLSLREQGNRFMQQASDFEKVKQYDHAADSYLSAKLRFLLSAKRAGNGFFSDAAEDRRRADEAALHYARVDELASEQEQEEVATKTPKRKIASVSVPSGFANLDGESAEEKN